MLDRPCARGTTTVVLTVSITPVTRRAVKRQAAHRTHWTNAPGPGPEAVAHRRRVMSRCTSPSDDMPSSISGMLASRDTGQASALRRGAVVWAVSQGCRCDHILHCGTIHSGQVHDRLRPGRGTAPTVVDGAVL